MLCSFALLTPAALMGFDRPSQSCSWRREAEECFHCPTVPHAVVYLESASMVCVEVSMAEVLLTHRGAHRRSSRAIRLLGINSVAKVRRDPAFTGRRRRITAMGLASFRSADAGWHAEGDLDFACDHRAPGCWQANPYPLMGLTARESELAARTRPVENTDPTVGRPFSVLMRPMPCTDRRASREASGRTTRMRFTHRP